MKENSGSGAHTLARTSSLGGRWFFGNGKHPAPRRGVAGILAERKICQICQIEPFEDRAIERYVAVV